MITLDQALAKLKLPFTLAPLQHSDIQDLSQYDRVALFWETGVGKTVGATVLAKVWDAETNLIVLPPILVPQWVQWLKEVDPDSTVAAYYGPKRSAEDLNAKWVVTSHAIFRIDYAKLQARFLKHRVTTIVDEAQALKNVSSKLYRLVKTFSQGQPLALLTATPTSKPDDAFAFISLKTPKAYRSYGHFASMHVAERDYFDQVTEWRDLETVSNNLMLQASKRTKEEVFAGMLNPPVYKVIKYDLDPAHMRLYSQLVDEALLELVSSGQKIDGTTPNKLYHLVQQMVLGYAHFSDNPSNRPVGFDILDATVDETGCLDPSRSKLICWSYYQRSSALLTSYLNSKYPGSTVAAYGAVNSAKSVAAFMFDPATRILVGQPLSVGMGLNANKVCSEMLFLEFSTTSMHARQSIGRVDRVGQTRIPNIRFAVANGTIQERLMFQLFKNDRLVSIIEKNPKSLREALLGKLE